MPHVIGLAQDWKMAQLSGWPKMTADLPRSPCPPPADGRAQLPCRSPCPSPRHVLSVVALGEAARVDRRAEAYQAGLREAGMGIHSVDGESSKENNDGVFTADR